MRLKPFACAALAWIVASCGASAGGSQAPKPEAAPRTTNATPIDVSAVGTRPVTPAKAAVPDVLSIGFGSRTLRAAISRRVPDRERGLMGRKSLAQDEGMVFLYREASDHSFWMKDCLMSLDILYVDDDGTVSALGTLPPAAPGAPSDRVPRFGTVRPSRIVVEAEAGAAAAAGVQVGTKLVLPPELNALFAESDL